MPSMAGVGDHAINATGSGDTSEHQMFLNHQEAQFVQAMDGIEAYLQLQAKLTKLLKQGCFSLAQARYSMNRAVGQLQYHLDAEATTRIAIAPKAHLDAGCVFELRVGVLPTRCHTHASSSSDGEDESYDVFGRPSQQQDSASTNAHHVNQIEVCSKDATAKAKAANSAAPAPAPDPLRWFGVLVPPSLREAQGSFQAVVQTVVELANAAQRMQQHQEQEAPLKD